MVKKTNSIGLAMAGHAFRATGNDKKAARYNNPLTDMVNMLIAECYAQEQIKSRTANKQINATEPARDDL